mgnify:FL=1
MTAPPWADGPLAGVAAALGVGLLVGLERERRKGERRDEHLAAGVRSFTVASLLGALAQGLERAVPLPGAVLLGGAMVGLLAFAAYWRSPARHPGLTTELALCTTYLIGVLCMVSPLWGAGAGALLALLLVARGRLHRFATQVLTENELHDGLLLAALALVALPLVPGGPVAALGGVSLRPLAALVLLILLLQAAGHIALRVFGARAGLGLSGFFSGFVSSTATIASMGARSAHGDVPLRAAQAGALASTAATWVQCLLLLSALSPPLARALLPAAALGLTVALGSVAWSLHGQAAAESTPGTGNGNGEVLRIREAALVAALLGAATVGVGWAGRAAGSQGVIGAAALAALADFHASVAALGALAGSGQASVETARWGLWAAFGANALVRATVALGTGGRVFGRPVALGLALQVLLAGAWIALD